jgi:hypothetical protein
LGLAGSPGNFSFKSTSASVFDNTVFTFKKSLDIDADVGYGSEHGIDNIQLFFPQLSEVLNEDNPVK